MPTKRLRPIDLEEELAKAHKQNAELKSLLEQSEKNAAKQKKILQDGSSKYQELTKRLEHSDKQLANAAKRESDLKTQLNEQSRLLNLERIDHRKQLQALQTALNKEERTLIDLQAGAVHSNEKAERTVERFRTKLQERAEACSRLEQQRTSDSQTIAELRVKLEIETRRAKVAEDENKDYKCNLEDATVKLARLEQQKLILQQQVDELSRQMSDTERNQQTAKLNKISLKQTVKNLEQAVASCSEENKGLKYALEARELDKRESARQVEELKAKLNGEIDVNQEMREELSEMAKQLESTSQLLTKQELEITRLTEKDFQAKQRISKLERQLEDDFGEVQSLQAKLKETLEELEGTRRQCVQLEKDVEAIQESQSNAITGLENQVVYIEQQLGRLREENRAYASREQELLKELRNIEANSEVYKEKAIEAGQRARQMESEVSKTERSAQRYVEEQLRGLEKSKGFKDQIVSTRLDALSDIKSLIRAHKNRH